MADREKSKRMKPVNETVERAGGVSGFVSDIEGPRKELSDRLKKHRDYASLDKNNGKK